MVGSVIARLVSLDISSHYSFEVPVKDPLAGMSRVSGNYPWRLDGGYSTVLHLKNTVGKEVHAIVQVRYAGGSYNPDRIKLEPYQTVALDLRVLRDSRKKDIRNTVMPKNVDGGQVIWYEEEPGTLIGRAEIFSLQAGVSSSFSCGGTCYCPLRYRSDYMSPASVRSIVGDQGQAFVPTLMRQDCNQTPFGPYNMTSSSTWSSTNTSVATVSSSGWVNCISPGSSNIDANFQITDYDDVTPCNPRPLPLAPSGPITVIGVTTQTVATTPTDRTRKRVGVGEQVTLTVQPTSLSPISWSISGPGTLSATSGNPVTFTAHERASTPTVTATYQGTPANVTFTVVEPNGQIIEQEPGTGVWHTQWTVSCGFKGRPYILPDDVSFQYIQVREGTVNGTASGYLAPKNGEPHQAGPWVVVAGPVTPVKGTKVNTVDTIASGTYTWTPYAPGTFTWNIPWLFKVGAGAEKQFTTVTHQEITDATGKLTISKGGTSKSKNLNDPNSNY